MLEYRDVVSLLGDRVGLHGSQRYRTDIDGLRAIAVLLVVLEHLGFTTFSGGYVGVDVFFVISGYLIGGSLIADFSRGTFSLLDFYERRVRRILPALLVLLVAVTVASIRYVFQAPLIAYATSLISVLFSVSNMLFGHQDGYFAPLSPLKPLLNTWSLGVEEQFYIAFPLLLLGVFRCCRRHLLPALWTCAALSLFASGWLMRVRPYAAFFWGPPRAWELLAGVLITQYPFRIYGRRIVREAAAVGGLLLVVLPGLFYVATTPFPGLTAMPPCLGAMLLLSSGGKGSTAVSRLLSLTPLAFVGLISYSLYLWHWPLIVLQRTTLCFSAHTMAETRIKLLLLFLSLLLATLSWKFVETPFRRGRLRPGRKPLFLLTGAVSAALLVVAGVLLHGDGYPGRFSPEVLKMVATEYSPVRNWNVHTCFLEQSDPFSDFKPEVCLKSVPGRRNYLVYGDSTAANLYAGLVSTFPDIHFLQGTVAGCRAGFVMPPDGACAALHAYLEEDYLRSHHPDAILLAGAWGPAEVDGVREEVAHLRAVGQRVILIGPVIQFDLPLPRLLGLELQRHDSPAVRAERITLSETLSARKLDAEMAQRAREDWHVPYVSYFQTLCTGHTPTAWLQGWMTTDGCPVLNPDGTPLLFDTVHLTPPGERLFAQGLRTQKIFAQ